MRPEKLIRHVDDSGTVHDSISPSKVLAWIVVGLVLAYAGIWLWQMADPAQEPMSSELVLGAVVAGGGALAYALFNRPGTLLEEALQRTPGAGG